MVAVGPYNDINVGLPNEDAEIRKLIGQVIDIVRLDVSTEDISIEESANSIKVIYDQRWQLQMLNVARSQFDVHFTEEGRPKPTIIHKKVVVSSSDDDEAPPRRIIVSSDDSDDEKPSPPKRKVSKIPVFFSSDDEEPVIINPVLRAISLRRNRDGSSCAYNSVATLVQSMALFDDSIRAKLAGLGDTSLPSLLYELSQGNYGRLRILKNAVQMEASKLSRVRGNQTYVDLMTDLWMPLADFLRDHVGINSVTTYLCSECKAENSIDRQMKLFLPFPVVFKDYTEMRRLSCQSCDGLSNRKLTIRQTFSDWALFWNDRGNIRMEDLHNVQKATVTWYVHAVICGSHVNTNSCGHWMVAAIMGTKTYYVNDDSYTELADIYSWDPPNGNVKIYGALYRKVPTKTVAT